MSMCSLLTSLSAVEMRTTSGFGAVEATPNAVNPQISPWYRSDCLMKCIHDAARCKGQDISTRHLFIDRISGQTTGGPRGRRFYVLSADKKSVAFSTLSSYVQGSGLHENCHLWKHNRQGRTCSPNRFVQSRISRIHVSPQKVARCPALSRCYALPPFPLRQHVSPVFCVIFHLHQRKHSVANLLGLPFAFVAPLFAPLCRWRLGECSFGLVADERRSWTVHA